MKKILSLIILLMIIVSCICYQIYIKKGNEEIEVLNTDVSINNIKSIIDIKNEINDSYEEVPLGYNDGSIYILKYDSANKKLCDNNIFILNKDGSSTECGIKLPEDYANCELSIYGDKIFGKDGYFNWQSGKEYKLLSDENDELSTNWYSVSGNTDYYLCVKNNSSTKKYILYDINSKDEYRFECSLGSDDAISGIFYDDISKKFYVICFNNVIKEIVFNGSNFILEKYDDIKVNSKDNAAQNEGTANNYLSYTYCLEDQVYIGLDYNNKNQGSTNINQYNIADKFTEQLSNITLYGYDNFYKEYILIKKDDDKSSDKIYLAKLEKNGFDMLIEIPKIYGDDSVISIHMVNSENVLVKEESHDKENKKIKNRYIVYDFAEYLQDNANKLKNDNDKLTLKNTYRNINEYTQQDDSNYKNKSNQSEGNKKDEGVTQEKVGVKDNKLINESVNEKERDYREYDSSWRKGNGEWYYYKDNDEKIIGWLKTEKGWYYFYKDGTMQKDAIVRGKNGQEYILGHDGLLLNPDHDLDYNYDGSEEKTNKGNNNDSNSKDKHNIEEESNVSNETKDKQNINKNSK